MPAFDPDKFVNREKELSHVQELIAGLKSGEPFSPHERVVHFIGPAGIGKSCLLEKLNTNFIDDPKCIPVLIKLDTIGNSQGKFIVNFHTVLDEEVSRIFKLDSLSTKPQLSDALSLSYSILIRTIRISTSGRIFVLLLDEIDIPMKEELRGLEKLLLNRLVEENERTVLITAGRKRPELNPFSLRPSHSNTFSLLPFDKKAVRDQLNKLKSGSEVLADQVLDIGGGVPGNNLKLAELVVGSPPQIPDELQAVQSLLGDVKSEIDEHFHPIIEAICVLTSFNPDDVAPLLESHPVLGNEWCERNIRDIFIKLKQVRLGPGGLINWDREKRSWVMDEPARALFERELQMRDAALWKELHCTACRMFRQWGEEYDSPLYRDKAVYHWQQLQAAGENCDNLGNENQ